MKKTAGRKFTSRQLWLAVHLYLGLLLGAIIAVIGITGSLLVFYVELDESLNPELIVSDAEKPKLSYENLYQSLLNEEPERLHGWRLEIPKNPQRAVTARYYKPQETEHLGFAPLLVSVDPYSGTVVAKRFWGQFAMTWLYDLHYTLLLSHTGKTVMAVIGGGLLISLLSGVYLWWPPLHKLKQALCLKTGASPERFNYDLHKIAGTYSLIVMLVLTLTGIALEIPHYINPAIGFFSPLHQPPKPESTPDPYGNRISLDQAVAIAHRQFPEARLCWIETPDGEKGSYRINLRQTEEPSQRFPKTNVWVDQFNGQILAVATPEQHSEGDSLIAWLHPLHSGEAFALPGRLLVFVAGLTCPLLFITGVIRWQHKRRSKKLRQDRLKPLFQETV